MSQPKFSTGQIVVDHGHGSVPAEIIREVRPGRRGRRYSTYRKGLRTATVYEDDLRHRDETAVECMSRCRHQPRQT